MNIITNPWKVKPLIDRYHFKNLHLWQCWLDFRLIDAKTHFHHLTSNLDRSLITCNHNFHVSLTKKKLRNPLKFLKLLFNFHQPRSGMIAIVGKCVPGKFPAPDSVPFFLFRLLYFNLWKYRVQHYFKQLLLSESCQYCWQQWRFTRQCSQPLFFSI